MIIQILFIITAVISIVGVLKVISVITGNQMNAPLPILHFFSSEVDASHVYTFFPSLMFQVWFWSQPLFEGGL